MRSMSRSLRLLLAGPTGRALFLVAVMSGVLVDQPADARDCAEREHQRARQLEHKLSNCLDDAECKLRARDRCVDRLAHMSCNTEVCLPPPGGTIDEICVFQTAEQVEPKIDKVFKPLTPVVNAVWPEFATGDGLDPLDDVYDGTVSIGSGFCDPLGDAACLDLAGFCTGTKATAHVTNLVGLKKLVFSDLAIDSLTTEDISAFQNGGPFAGRINVDPIPPDGTAWDDPKSAIVLPIADRRSAITIDLGENILLCSTFATCGSVIFQGSGNATYQIDTSLDGSDWSKWIDIPVMGSVSDLRTRQMSEWPQVEARHLRVFATGGAVEYSVSALRVAGFTEDGTFVTRANLNKPAAGPQPLIMSSIVASPGDKSTDPLATVLPFKGTSSAVTIDLGRIVSTMGQPGLLDVSGNDHYVLDYSLNGVSWEQWFTVGPVNPSTSKIARHATPFAPVSAMRFVRIYADTSQGSASDGVYSVAALAFGFSAPPGTPMNPGPISPMDELLPVEVRGPESLITNSERAAEKTAWNDTRYAMVLPSSLSDAKSQAPVIDLGKATGRGIDRVRIQASADDDYQVDISSDAKTWRSLWLAKATSSSKDHLTTRDSGADGTLLIDPDTGKPFVGQYIRVYPVKGDSKHSVSELEIFNNLLVRGCPFDSTSNEGDLGSATCGFSGTAVGQATFPECPPGGGTGTNSDCLTVEAEGKLTFECATVLGTETVELASVNVKCGAGSPTGLATVDFCAVSCGDPADRNEETAMTFMKIDKLKLGVDGLACEFDGVSPPWPVDAGLTFFEKDIVAALEPTIQKELDKILKEETPFPPGDVCSEDP